MTKNPVVKKECRHAIWMQSKAPDVPDLHLIKEVLHFEDGSTRPHIRYEKNFLRDFYVTKPPYRNHQQKKECEALEKLNKYSCTQSDLRMKAARALDMPYSSVPLKQLAASPYLYGTDISSTALIKRRYMDEWPNTFTPYSVAFLDIETDVVHGTDDPIVMNILFKRELHIWVTQQLVEGYADPEALYRQAVKKRIQTYVDQHHITITFKVVPHTVDLIQESFAYLHAQSPDFVAIWNMDFDVPRMLDTLKKYKVDPKDVFSDPKIPPHLRFCKYKKGSTKKVTASGAIKPKNPSEQWHSLYCPAGFYIIDAMCTYRFLRQGDQEMPDYKLNTILEANDCLTKLEIEEASHLQELDWHVFMQKHLPFDYCCYGNVDVLSMFDLEEKTKDLQQAFPVRSAHSDFSQFAFQTKRFADKYHCFLLKHGQVVATVPPRENKDVDDQALESEYDDVEDEEETTLNEQGEVVTLKSDVLGLRDWIVTLKAHMSVLGLKLIEECEAICTMIRAFTYDSDAVSAYPSCAMAANVSLATTYRELIDILDIEEEVFRNQHINLMQGHVNALEFCQVMYKLPAPQDTLKYFDDL